MAWQARGWAVCVTSCPLKLEQIKLHAHFTGEHTEAWEGGPKLTLSKHRAGVQTQLRVTPRSGVQAAEVPGDPSPRASCALRMGNPQRGLHQGEVGGGRSGPGQPLQHVLGGAQVVSVKSGRVASQNAHLFRACTRQTGLRGNCSVSPSIWGPQSAGQG